MYDLLLGTTGKNILATAHGAGAETLLVQPIILRFYLRLWRGELFDAYFKMGSGDPRAIHLICILSCLVCTHGSNSMTLSPRGTATVGMEGRRALT